MIQKVVKGWKLRALEWPSPAKGRLWSHPMERMVTKQVEWPKQMVTTVTSPTMQNHKEQLGAKGLKLTQQQLDPRKIKSQKKIRKRTPSLKNKVISLKIKMKERMMPTERQVQQQRHPKRARRTSPVAVRIQKKVSMTRVQPRAIKVSRIKKRRPKTNHQRKRNMMKEVLLEKKLVVEKQVVFPEKKLN